MPKSNTWSGTPGFRPQPQSMRVVVVETADEIVREARSDGYRKSRQGSSVAVGLRFVGSLMSPGKVGGEEQVVWFVVWRAADARGSVREPQNEQLSQLATLR